MNRDELRSLDLVDTESSMLGRLHAVVLARPYARAAHVDGIDLTWGELEQRSNALALQLHSECGQGPEPIAIIGASGVDMIIAPLATLKSGRPYTAIESTLPLARVLQIVSLSGARSAVIGTLKPDVVEALESAGLSLHRVRLDRAEDGPRVHVGANDPANVVFTSGSTGTPKGVVVPHRYHLLHAVTYAERGFSSNDRVGLVVPMSFALGAIVFWRTMLLGATILPFDPRVQGVPALVAWCDDRGIEVMEATPSLFRAIARTTNNVLESLKIVESAGEPLFARDAIDIGRRLPPTCAFRNCIGSSETGAYGFFDILDRGQSLKGIVPVGTAIAHKEITVEDAEGRVIADGTTGEIVVTSSFMATGYWRQPEATALRFETKSDGRIRYRTGDLGRWLQDGSLLHLGRGDGMVKIRGYLVEPAEVEAALLDTGLVHEAAAFGVNDGDGDPSLHAYVVPIDGLRSSNAAIRRALRERVPEYLVPASLKAVPSLPKNDNNKIDRSILEPIATREAECESPRDDWEGAVAQVWCRILGVDQVGIEDDFFSLGGDSLGVIELMAAMSEDHGVTLRSSDLVECPTLGAFAARARQPTLPRAGVLVQLLMGIAEPPLFFFAGGGGLAGDFLLLARYLNLDRSVYGLQARGVEGGGIPDWTTRSWAARCIRQMRNVQPHGPYYLGGHSFGGVVAMEAAHQLRRAGEDIALLVLIDTLAPYSTGFGVQVFGEDRVAQLATVKSSSVLQVVRRTRLALTRFFKINFAGIRPRDTKEQFELFFHHAEFLNRRYRPSPLDSPTVMYLADSVNSKDEPYKLAHLLNGPWEIHTRPGNHLSIMGEPNVESLADHLRSRIEQPSRVGRRMEDEGSGVSHDPE